MLDRFDVAVGSVGTTQVFDQAWRSFSRTRVPRRAPLYSDITNDYKRDTLDAVCSLLSQHYYRATRMMRADKEKKLGDEGTLKWCVMRFAYEAGDEASLGIRESFLSHLLKMGKDCGEVEYTVCIPCTAC